MANNCLVTKLKSVVQNDNLDYLGGLIISVKGSSGLKLVINSKVSQKIKVLEGSSSQAVEGEITVPADTDFNVFCQTTSVKLLIEDKYAIRKISNGTSTVSFNLDGLKYTDDIEVINFPSSDYSMRITGALSSISDKTNLTVLKIKYAAVSGQLSDLTGLTNLSELHLGDCEYIEGDISAFGELTSLTTISAGGNTIYGTLESVARGQVHNGRTTGSIEWGYMKFAPRVTFNGDNPWNTNLTSLSWQLNASDNTKIDVTYNDVTITIDAD